MYRFIAYGVIWIVGLIVMPPLSRELFPGFAYRLNPTPDPFLYVAKVEGKPDGVLVRYNTDKSKHKIIAGDTAAFLASPATAKMYRGNIESLERVSIGKKRILEMTLEEDDDHWMHLKVKYDAIGADGAEYIYRETSTGVEPSWATYTGNRGWWPILGGEARIHVLAYWSIFFGIAVLLIEVVRGRIRRHRHEASVRAALED